MKYFLERDHYQIREKLFKTQTFFGNLEYFLKTQIFLNLWTFPEILKTQSFFEKTNIFLNASKILKSKHFLDLWTIFGKSEQFLKLQLFWKREHFLKFWSLIRMCDLATIWRTKVSGATKWCIQPPLRVACSALPPDFDFFFVHVFGFYMVWLFGVCLIFS